MTVLGLLPLPEGGWAQMTELGTTSSGTGGELPSRGPRRLSDLSDVELVVATRDGVSEAYGEFYARVSPRLFGYFRVRCHEAQDAYDLGAEAFAEFLDCLDRYDEAKGSPTQWLYGIAANLWKQYVRSGAIEHRARLRLGMSTASVAPDELERLDELVDLRDERAQVTAAVGRLPPNLRAAVLARVVDGDDYAAIAARLGVREPAVRKRVSRGLAMLADDYVESAPFRPNPGRL